MCIYTGFSLDAKRLPANGYISDEKRWYMSIGIYYFTGTGNTLKVVRDLSAALDGAQIVPVKKLIKEDRIKVSCDTLILAFPVYVFGAPLIMFDLAKKLDIPPSTKIYAVATYGGLLARSLPIFKAHLKKHGIILQGGFGVQMPGNYQPLYDVPEPKKQQKLFLHEKKSVARIAEKIKSGKKFGTETAGGPLGFLLSYPMRKSAEKTMRKTDAAFYTNEKCISCGQCEKICPVQNITFENKKPAWHHRCEGCLACMHWCPEKAIQFNKKTEIHGRYHNPEISLRDIL